jgi:hypothetical protein
MRHIHLENRRLDRAVRASQPVAAGRPGPCGRLPGPAVSNLGGCLALSRVLPPGKRHDFKMCFEIMLFHTNAIDVIRMFLIHSMI